MAIRPQPYRFKWPWSASQVEGVDESFQILFKAVRTLEKLVASITGTPTTTTITTVESNELGNGAAMGRRGRDGEDSTRSRPPVGSYLQNSYVPLIAGIGTVGTATPTLFPLTTAAPAINVESTVSAVNAAMRVGASIGANSAYMVLAGNRAIDLQNFAAVRAVNSASGSEANVANINFSKDGTDSSTAALIKFDIDNGSAIATRMVIKGTGRVGIGVTAPTAELHIAAGSATANTAPLKFNSGTLLTTAEAGAVEFLTDAYYGTITTGAARKTFAFLESPTFTTPNIGAATGTSLVLTAALTSTYATINANASANALAINGRNNVAGEAFLTFFKLDGTTAHGYIEGNNTRVDHYDAGFNLVMSVSSKNLGIGGVTAPTARLHLAAGSATASTAPLKFNSGTNLTTAEAGAAEYNGTNLFFTRAGTVRENVLVAIDNVAAPSTGVGVAIVNFYGASATNYLGDPNRWLSVNVLGSTYKIPLYN